MLEVYKYSYVHKFVKSKKLPKNCLLFSCIPQAAMCCEKFVRFHRRKFEKITNKAIRKSKKHTCGHLKFEIKIQDKTLFNHCLLRVIRLRGLGVKTNAKTTFKRAHLPAEHHK